MSIRDLEKIKRALLKEKAGYEKLLTSPIFKLSGAQEVSYNRRLKAVNEQLEIVEKELTAKRKNRKRWG
jgi:hypothetical protein